MEHRSYSKRLALEATLIVVAIITGVAIVMFGLSDDTPLQVNLLTGLAFTLSIVMFLWLVMDPDTAAAKQSDEVLQLASQTLDCTKQGLDFDSAQRVCELILPTTPAMAVAITNREVVLGYAGYNAENNEPGRPIRTTATRQTLQDGKPRILHRTDDIGLPMSSARINAAIVQPLYIGSSIEGTVKFYYRHNNQMSKTQISLAHGLAELLSTQMAASALEEQIKLTTSMELKALQAQINPHFLFNTLNTIAAFIRIDPDKARVLLRDFSAFYRSTLENADDLIPLERELKQVERYFSFELARFGEDRLALEINLEPEVGNMLVPSFLVQPIVENAVKHAMKAEGKLTVRITGETTDDMVIIRVADDGAGMPEETLDDMMNKESDTGLGIAVKNVKDRIRGYFGPQSHMEVTSALDEGTTVTFYLDKDVATGGLSEAAQLQESAIPNIPQPAVQ